MATLIEAMLISRTMEYTSLKPSFSKAYSRGGGFDGITVAPIDAVEQITDFRDPLTVSILPGNARLTNHSAVVFENGLTLCAVCKAPYDYTLDCEPNQCGNKKPARMALPPHQPIRVNIALMQMLFVGHFEIYHIIFFEVWCSSA